MNADAIVSALKEKHVQCGLCGGPAKGGLVTVLPSKKDNFDLYHTCQDCASKMIKGK